MVDDAKLAKMLDDLSKLQKVNDTPDVQELKKKGWELKPTVSKRSSYVFADEFPGFADKKTAYEFLAAVKSGNLKKVQEIVEKQPAIVNTAATVMNRRFALHKAIQHDRLEIVDYLIVAGKADVNLKEGVNGDTPLHYAARLNKPHAASKLLRAGANIHARNKHGAAPWKVAAESSPPVHEIITSFEKNVFDIVAMNKQQELTNHFTAGLKATFARGDGYSLLHHAAFAGQEEMLDILLKRQADPRQKDSYGRTPLHWACDTGKNRIVHILVGVLESLDPAAVNEKDNCLWTPLHYATSKRHLACVKEILLASRVELSHAELFYEATPLHIACCFGYFEIAEALVGAGANKDLKDSGGMTAQVRGSLNGFTMSFMAPHANEILEAAATGNVQMLMELLNQGVAVNAQQLETRKTPLHMAVQGGHLEAVRILLSYDADPCSEDSNKETPLDLVRKGVSVGSLDPKMEVVFQMNNAVKSLFSAIDSSDAGEVSRLLNSGVNPNTTNKSGNMPLHVAAAAGFSNVVQVLCKHRDTVVDALNREEKSALHLAAFNQHHHCVSELIKNGANIQLPDNIDQFTPLMWATKKASPTTVQVLLDAGADVQYRAPKSQLNALDLAYQSKNAQIIDLLQWHIMGQELLRACERDSREKVKQILDIEELRLYWDNDEYVASLSHVDRSTANQYSIRRIVEEKSRNFTLDDFKVIDQELMTRMNGILFNPERLKDIMGGVPVDFDAFMLKEMWIQARRRMDHATGHALLTKLMLINKQVRRKPENYPPLVNYADENGNTPLFFAAQKGPSCVSLLLKAGADVLVTNKKRQKPIDTIKDQPHLQNVFQMLKMHEKAMQLLAACNKGIQSQVEQLVNVDQVDVNCENSAQETPLFVASLRGRVRAMEFLISKGANVNARTRLEETPLHAAVTAVELPVPAVKLLLEKGAESVKNRFDMTPLALAKQRQQDKDQAQLVELLQFQDFTQRMRDAVNAGNWSEMETLMLQSDETGKPRALLNHQYKDTGDTIVHIAIKNNHHDIVQRLLDKKPKLLTKDNEGKTPYALAVQFNFAPDLVQLLLVQQHGLALLESSAKGEVSTVKNLVEKEQVDVNFVDEYGNSALHWASAHNQAKCVKALLSLNADVSWADHIGDTALHIAAFYNATDSLEELLKDKRTDVNVVNRDLNSPLAYALMRRHNQAVKMLLQARAFVSMQNSLGESPLLYAATFCSGAMMSAMLKEKNVDADVSGPEGVTPLIAAIKSGNADCIQALLDANVDVDKTDDLGNTPLMYACLQGFDQVIESIAKKSKHINHNGLGNATAVHMACFSGSAKCLMTLIERGANCDPGPITMDEDWKITPLEIALARGNHHIAKILLQAAGASQEPNKIYLPTKKVAHSYKVYAKSASLLHGSKTGNVSLVLDILKVRTKLTLIDLNWCDLPAKMTSLHWATLHGHIEIVRLLLKAGASQTEKNKEGDTAMDIAKKNKDARKEIIALLKNPPTAEKGEFDLSDDEWEYSDSDDSDSDDSESSEDEKPKKGKKDKKDKSKKKDKKKKKKKREKAQGLDEVVLAKFMTLHLTPVMDKAVGQLHARLDQSDEKLQKGLSKTQVRLEEKMDEVVDKQIDSKKKKDKKGK